MRVDENAHPALLPPGKFFGRQWLKESGTEFKFAFEHSRYALLWGLSDGHQTHNGLLVDVSGMQGTRTLSSRRTNRRDEA